MQKRRLRANRVAFYVNDKELELLQKNANNNNMSVSEFLRSCIIYNAEIKELREKEKTFIDNFKELQKIGVNLNQLTRNLNKFVNTSSDSKDKNFFYTIINEVKNLGIEKNIRNVLEDMANILAKLKGKER